MIWPTTEPVTSTRLLLESLSVQHAAEMVDVLADPSLYEYTGGDAPTLEQLEHRYAAQSIRRSEDEAQGWFNWVVRLGRTAAPIGFVQATVEHDGSVLVGNMAWVISPIHQGQGFASEAAQAMTGWLRSKGVRSFVAFVHPQHQASMGVARHLGLHPTAIVEEGEIRWES